MAILPPLPNLISSLHLHPLASRLLTTTGDATSQYSLLPLSITLLFSVYLCTTPLPLYIAYTIVQRFRALKAENAALKEQRHEMQREREVLRQAQTQVFEEMKLLEEIFQGFKEMFREFQEAVRDLRDEASATEHGDDDEDGSFVDLIDTMHGSGD